MKELICIVCPRGCNMKYEIKDGEYVITENHCNRGPAYLKQEVTNPTRMLTTTISVIDGEIDVLPVYSKEYVPKDEVFAIINELKTLKIHAPIKCNDIIVNEVLGKHIQILASKTINKRG